MIGIRGESLAYVAQELSILCATLSPTEHDCVDLASRCLALSYDMDTAKAITGWFRGHPRDSGGTPQRTKAARANTADSDSGLEETAAQRRDCENEELRPPRAIAHVDGGRTGDGLMELEVKHDESDPVLCHLGGMAVVQYPDDLHADESKKDVLKDPEYDALQEDDDEDDDESMSSGGERMSENKTKVKKEGGVRTDHKWALVRKENEAAFLRLCFVVNLRLCFVVNNHFRVLVRLHAAAGSSASCRWLAGKPATGLWAN